MNPESPATSAQPCPRCGAALDTTGTPAGTWLSCPGCGQPLRVRSRAVSRPSQPDPNAEPELPSVAWADDPRLAEPPACDLKALPPWRSERRAGVLQVLVLCTLAGFAHAMFAGSFLMVVNPKELAICGLFGALAALFVAVMVNTLRLGRDRRTPLSTRAINVRIERAGPS